MKNIFFVSFIIFCLFSLNNCQGENEHVKMYQFDYINLESPIEKKLIPIFDSIDYYLSLLFKKYEVKDYNYFHRMYYYLNQKKICKKISNLKFNSDLLIQKDISYLIIPKLKEKKNLKKIYEIKNSICKGDYSIPRVVELTIKYEDESSFEEFLDNKLNQDLLFNEFIRIIIGRTILNFYNLKRNKLISPNPNNYLYFSSYEKFINLVNISNEQFFQNFSDIGKSYIWPDMPYFNDFLTKSNNNLESSFTEITLNIIKEYPYNLAKCDLLYNYQYNNKKQCIRIDQKCVDDCSYEKMFLEYYIDEKNKKLVCNLNSRNNLLNKQCSKLYGNVLFDEFYQFNNMNKYLKVKEKQKLLMLNPSPKCKNNIKTIFFEYSDFYKDDPYYYFKNKIKVEYKELYDSNYFVVANVDKKKNYLTKYKNLIFNNIFVNNKKNWNYNLYWDYDFPLLNIENNINKYTRIGKFPDESINRYNINLLYNQLKTIYPNDFDYIPETYFFPEQTDIIKNKFNGYKFRSNNAWIIDQLEKNENITSTNKYPELLSSLDKILSKENSKDNLVLSKYISNPMLINHKKFEMKFFVLITGFSPLKIYIYRDGYLILGGNEYNLNETNINDKCMHITSEKNEINCSKNKYEDSLFEENCNIWSFLNFERYCKRNDINYYNIINQAKDIIIKTFISLSENIIKSSKSKSLKDRNMFQLFTFDFLLDNNLKLYLIDMDKNPKLNSKHLVPIYIYDHIFSDILNIVGIVPFNHEYEKKTFENNNNISHNIEIEENVEEAICEFGRTRGMFELVFPEKNIINKYKKYFRNNFGKENELLWENIEKNDLN